MANKKKQEVENPNQDQTKVPTYFTLITVSPFGVVEKTVHYSMQVVMEYLTHNHPNNISSFSVYVTEGNIVE